MKIIAIGGAVLLAAILAFELPHYLGGSKSPATSASGATTTTTTAATGTPMPAGGTAAAAVLPASSSTKLQTSDLQPVRTKSQLYAFSRFSGKNPFVPQVSNSPTTSSSGSAGTSGSTGTTGSTGSTGTSGSTGSSGSTSGAQSAPKGVSGSSSSSSSSSAASVSSMANSATVEVNGKIQSVPVGASFPTSNPVFKLVSVTSKAAKVGISNGGFSNGKQTVSVAVGRSLTLVNKTNGRRYVLLLLSVS
jgi:hypothetical protein